jgi:hypothetical protein
MYAVKMITVKQDRFIRSLLDGRVVSPAVRLWIEQRITDMSSRDASKAIGVLLDCPVVEVPTTPDTAVSVAVSPGSEVIEPGIYERDGSVYQVVRSKTSGFLYGKVLTPTGSTRLTEAGTVIDAKYKYFGVVPFLRTTDRVSAERAQELSTVHGYCVVCGRRLDAGDSVAAGIGPVCAGKV